MFDVRQSLSGFALLRAMGLSTQPLENQLTESLGAGMLSSALLDSFQHGMPGAALARMLQSGNMPAGLLMNPPGMPRSRGAGWAASRQPNFGSHFAGRNAALMSRFMQSQPFARQQLEMMLGGRVMGMGANGQLQVQRHMTGSGSGCPSCIQDMFSSMAQGSARASGMSGNPGQFMNMIAGGLGQLLGGRQQAQSHAMQSQQSQNRCGGGGCGSSGNSSLMGGGSISSVLSDPALTVEDRVTLMIMMIMKKMDQDIERQAQYINSLQQQQQSGGKGGKGGGGAPSIDVETMKLKRMIDKRSQMFDMLRQIIDKYNQTAKGIIDSMGR